MVSYGERCGLKDHFWDEIFAGCSGSVFYEYVMSTAFISNLASTVCRGIGGLGNGLGLGLERGIILALMDFLRLLEMLSRGGDWRGAGRQRLEWWKRV